MFSYNIKKILSPINWSWEIIRCEYFFDFRQIWRRNVINFYRHKIIIHETLWDCRLKIYLVACKSDKKLEIKWQSYWWQHIRWTPLIPISLTCCESLCHYVFLCLHLPNYLCPCLNHLAKVHSIFFTQK